MNGLTHSLAAYIADPKLGKHYQAARELAKTGVIDSIATMMAGRAETVVGIVMGYYGQAAANAGANNTSDLAPVPFAHRQLPAPQAVMARGHGAEHGERAGQEPVVANFALKVLDRGL